MTLAACTAIATHDLVSSRDVFDCAVIGAGPGGLVAAIYLQRLRRRVLVISAGEPRAARIPRIRNLVGYAEGIAGTELLARLNAQLSRCGGRVIEGRARVARTRGGFNVRVGADTYLARKVILATGQRDREPELGNERELTSRGKLGYCPICDGFDHADQKIALLVRSNAGVKKVAFMSGFSRDLVVVETEPFLMSPVRRLDLARRGIPVVKGPLRALTERGDGLLIEPKRGEPVAVDAAYVLLGSVVPRDAVAGLGLKRSDGGYLVVNSHQETSVPGLFAVGDCVNGLSQVSVAVGQAAVAATTVHNTL